jgi:hypothetical protein
MNAARLDALLEGDSPTVEDFGYFVSMAEKLPTELLWSLASSYPKLNHMLAGVAQKELQSKIQRKNIDDHLNSIVTSLRHKLTSI